MAIDDGRNIPPDLTAVRSAPPPRQPSGSPEWNYWANLAIVDYHDACILSRGFDPRSIRGNALPRDLESELRQRTSIAKSHLGLGLRSYSTEEDRYCARNIGTGVKLTEFRAWAEALPVPFTFPDEFPRARITEPKPQASPALEQPAAPATAPVDDKPLDERERASLLCIIGALATQQNLDLTQPHKAGAVIAAMLPGDVKLSARTIGEHLKAVTEAMDSRKR